MGGQSGKREARGNRTATKIGVDQKKVTKNGCGGGAHSFRFKWPLLSAEL
jgi:hypothetical protein